MHTIAWEGSHMMPETTTRVTRHTAEHINAQIRRDIEEHVARTAAAGPEAIHRRLEALDGKWDIERTLEANAAGVSLLGPGLGTFVDRRWFVLPAVVAGFLLQHAVQGWCPPVPLLRRLGVRTQTEIDYERYALKALQGDFQEVAGGDGDIGRLIEAVQR